jgi:hypothetical protein
LSLPCADLDSARAFWQQAGYEPTAVEVPWDGFALPSTPLAYHSRRSLAESVLLFQGATLGDDALSAAGLTPRRPIPALRDVPHRLHAGGDLNLLLY